VNTTNGLGEDRSFVQWQSFLKVTLYSLLLLVFQAVWASRTASAALKPDLLLPMMLPVAVWWPPVASLGWAILWGFMADTLSGKLWGYHVGSYVVSVCLVHIAAEKFEFQNPLYQMFFVGLCSLGQSLVLGLFLFLEPAGSLLGASAGRDLVGRFVLTMILSPLIIFPVWKDRASN